MILLRHLRAGFEKAESCGTVRQNRVLVGGETMGVDFLLDPGAAFFVASFILAPLLLLGFESATDRAVLMRDLGIPAGLIGCVIGTQNMINNAAGGTLVAEVIYVATSIAFLTTLYGGVISALGFFLSGSGRPEAKAIQNRRRLWRGKLICLLGFPPWIVYTVYVVGGLAAFFQPIPACIFLTVVVIAILTGRKGHYLSNLSQGCLISSLTSVLVGILILFRGETEFGLMVSVTGLIYGLVGYVGIYIATYSTDYKPHISATRTNWHWIELTGFLIFMFLAPDTLLDNYQEAAVQEQIKQLELRLDAKN
jgi:hypothetical protein